MTIYIVLLVVGLLAGVLIGTVIESNSASKYVKKSREELKSKDRLIATLTKQILHLKEGRY